MPTIYRTTHLTRSGKRLLLFVLVLVLVNYGLRLFHLRLGLIPFEQELVSDIVMPKAELDRGLAWLEFALIIALSHLVIFLIYLWLLLREIVWRLMTRPSVRLLSARFLLILGLGLSAVPFTLYLFLDPEAAEGTRAAGPRVFTGAMLSLATVLVFATMFVALKRPQAFEQTMRVHMSSRS